jgi:hypothetical protein
VKGERGAEGERERGRKREQCFCLEQKASKREKMNKEHY